jgi:hypothetical protein
MQQSMDMIVGVQWIGFSCGPYNENPC